MKVSLIFWCCITPTVILKPFSVYSLSNLLFFFCFDFALKQAFYISQQTVREFNHYIVVMINCLWNSRMFHTDNLGVKIDEEVLLRSKVPRWGARFSFINHPAFVSYAIDFHQRVGGCLLRCTHACSLIKVQLLLIIWLWESSEGCVYSGVWL